MAIAQTILQQLGGNKFIAMTGSKNFTALNSGLQMKLAKSKSKANILKITLNGTDLYDMEFIKFTPYKFNIKTMTERAEKIETVKKYEDVYYDMLQDIFTSETELRTSL